MATRRHKELYPKYSPKSIFGPMPKWIRQHAYGIERRVVRETLTHGEEPANRAIRRNLIGMSRYMWY